MEFHSSEMVWSIFSLFEIVMQNAVCSIIKGALPAEFKLICLLLKALEVLPHFFGIKF